MGCPEVQCLAATFRRCGSSALVPISGFHRAPTTAWYPCTARLSFVSSDPPVLVFPFLLRSGCDGRCKAQSDRCSPILVRYFLGVRQDKEKLRREVLRLGSGIRSLLPTVLLLRLPGKSVLFAPSSSLFVGFGVRRV